MGVHLGVWGFIPSHSLHSREHVMWLSGSLFARNLASPCLGREPKARVVTDEVDNEDDKNHHMNMERIRKKVEKKIALKHNAMKLFKHNEDNEEHVVHS